MINRCSRGYHILLSAVFVAGMLMAPRVRCQTARRAARPARPATKAKAAEEKKSKPRSPGEVSRELVRQLEEDRVPWQFYKHYIELYQGFSGKALALLKKSPAKAATAEGRWLKEIAEHYQSVAALLEQMIEKRRTIEEIRNSNTTVPPKDRRAVYKAATVKYQGSVNALVATLRDPPRKPGSRSAAAPR